MGNRLGRRRYHANESFNDESSVDDRALCRTIHFEVFHQCPHRSICSSWSQLVFSAGQAVWPWSLRRLLQCRWLFLSVFHDGSRCGSWPLAAFFYQRRPGRVCAPINRVGFSLIVTRPQKRPLSVNGVDCSRGVAGCLQRARFVHRTLVP